MMRRLVLLAVVMLVSGCGAQGGGDSSASSAQRESDISVSRLKDYASFADLRADSTAVVRVVAKDNAHIERVDGLPFTVTPTRVERVIWGKVDSSVLMVRQLGDPAMGVAETGPVLTAQRAYLLFVTPFAFSDNKPTGQYVVTGNQGLYVFDEKRSAFVFAGAGQPSLPTTLAATEAESAVLR